FTMTALPGTPAIQNAIPMPFLGTTPFAAPGLGTIAAAIMLFGGMSWLNRRARIAQDRGEGYSDSDAPGAATGNPGSPAVGDAHAAGTGAGSAGATTLPGFGVAI